MYECVMLLTAAEMPRMTTEMPRRMMRLMEILESAEVKII